jgi:hypothetical protein
MSCRAQDPWVERFERYCARTGISHAMLGQMAVNDGRFMARLRLGHCTLRVVNKVAAWFRQGGVAGWSHP